LSFAKGHKECKKYESEKFYVVRHFSII
jgi:hypothetical protein